MSELEQFKADIKELGSIIECKNGTIATLAKKRDNLKAENERLKEEIEIRDNLSEKFRKEALSWANIANEYQKDKTKLEQTLQEIKDIAERFKSADREESEKLLCLENDMEDILYRIAEVYNEK